MAEACQHRVDRQVLFWYADPFSLQYCAMIPCASHTATIAFDTQV